MSGCFSSAPKDPTGGGNGAPRGSTMNRPANSVVTTLKMDLGLEPKNDVYERDLAERARRSREIAEKNMANMMKDKNDVTSGPVASAPVASSGISPVSSAPSSDAVEAAGEAAFEDTDFDTSVGGAEDDALEVANQGSQSTILTSPSGLLASNEDDPKKRRRRSLIG